MHLSFQIKKTSQRQQLHAVAKNLMRSQLQGKEETNKVMKKVNL